MEVVTADEGDAEQEVVEAQEKSNDLRKKLAARQALSAAAPQGGGADGGARGRKRESGGGGGGMRENGYAKVEGPKVSRVMQTMCLTLGRETMASKRKAPEPADDDQAELAQREKRKEKSFLSIGQHASISRRHVDLVYDFHKRRWALLCLGRNGVYVDNVFVNQGDAPVPLRNKSRIEVPNALPLVFTCPPPQVVGGTALQRPTESLKVLIAQAMAERSDGSMMVGEIYQRIKDKHAFYRNQPEASWQSSIRHCLTINKCFVKIPKMHLDPAHKGACWTMVTDADPALESLLQQPPASQPTIPPAPQYQQAQPLLAAFAQAAAAAAAGGEQGSDIFAQFAGAQAGQAMAMRMAANGVTVNDAAILAALQMQASGNMLALHLHQDARIREALGMAQAQALRGLVQAKALSDLAQTSSPSRPPAPPMVQQAQSDNTAHSSGGAALAAFSAPKPPEAPHESDNENDNDSDGQADDADSDDADAGMVIDDE